MKNPRQWALLQRRALVLLATCIVAFSASAQQIPTTRAQTLAGATVNLPIDLHGKLGVLVLGFSKESSKQCHGWDDLIARDYAGDPRIVYYEMPALQDVPGFIRGMVLRGMRHDLNATAQARFLPLLQNEDAWKTLAGFGPGDDAYLLIVDGSGLVKWKTHGPVSAAAYADFRTRLKALQK